jgi:hypothetical protein
MVRRQDLVHRRGIIDIPARQMQVLKERKKERKRTTE